MRTTKASTEFKVRQSLLRAGTSTIGDLAKRTGFAYNTVKLALEVTGAEHLPGTWPRKWRYGNTPVIEEAVGTPRLGAVQESTIDVVLAVPTATDWVSQWNGGRKLFGADLAAVVINVDSDPSKLAQSMAEDSQSLAGLAYALQQVQDRPDWYEILGGDTEAKA